MLCCCNISALNVYPSDAVEANTRVSIFPPEVSRRGNRGYENTSVTPPDCSNESLRLAFPECIRNR